MSEFDNDEDEIMDDEILELENEDVKSDLDLAIEEIEEADSEIIEDLCKPCGTTKRECTYCDDNNEWPAGRPCKMCKGTGYRN